RGRTRLSHQGRLHARRTLSRHGTTSRCVECGAPEVGPAREAAQRAIDTGTRRRAVKAVIVGATKGMGRALARRMAERGDQLFLLGRDTEDLQRSATDLEIRGADGAVGTAHCDLLQPQSFQPALAAAGALARIDTIVVTAGLFAAEEELEQDAALRDRLLVANFVNTVHFCEL